MKISISTKWGLGRFLEASWLHLSSILEPRGAILATYWRSVAELGGKDGPEGSMERAMGDRGRSGEGGVPVGPA